MGRVDGQRLLEVPDAPGAVLGGEAIDEILALQVEPVRLRVLAVSCAAAATSPRAVPLAFESGASPRSAVRSSFTTDCAMSS